MRIVKTFDDYFEVYDNGDLTARLPLTTDEYSTIELHLASLEPPPDKVVLGNVPNEVSMRQARLALLHFGLLSKINAAITKIPGTQGEAARIEWEYSTSVRRDSVLVISLAHQLGLTEDQLDKLFLLASTFK